MKHIKVRSKRMPAHAASASGYLCLAIKMFLGNYQDTGRAKCQDKGCQIG